MLLAPLSVRLVPELLRLLVDVPCGRGVRHEAQANGGLLRAWGQWDEEWMLEDWMRLEA